MTKEIKVYKEAPQPSEDIVTRLRLVSGQTILGRYDVAKGIFQEVTIGEGLSISGAGVLTAPGGGGGTTLDALSDVVITSVGNNEVIQYDTGTGFWLNRTLAEAGISAVGHTHAASDIVSGTLADARIAESNVIQHEGAISITESQISDLQAYLTGADIGTIATQDSNSVAITGGTIAGITQLDVDDIRINGNTISSTSGGINITPLSGQSLNVSLSTTGDFVINTDDLVVDTSTGRIGVGITAPEYTVHVRGGGGALDGVMRFENTGTDATNKTGGVIVGHYTNTEEPINLAVVTSQSASTIFALGGGNALLNAITEMRIYTASNNTTTTGTIAITADSSQRVGIRTTSIDARLHVVEPTINDPVFKLESISTNTYPNLIIRQGKVTTLNATPATVLTLAIDADTTYLLESRILVRRQSGAGSTDNGGVYIIRSMVTTKSGTVTINAVDAEMTQEDVAGWGVTHAVSGSNVLVQVTGAASTVLVWHVTTFIQKIST